MKENVLERMKRLDTRRKMADFQVKMKQPYSFKVKYATIRAREFAAECERRGLNYHVSVGGLDSITLFLFLKSIGIDAPGISTSFLEDRSIQAVHRQLGIECLEPLTYIDANGKEHHWTKTKVIQELGFPVLSKEHTNADRLSAKLITAFMGLTHTFTVEELDAIRFLDRLAKWACEAEETDHENHG